MKAPIKKKRRAECLDTIYTATDIHKWANKMELQRLVSSKPEVTLKDHFMGILSDSAAGLNSIKNKRYGEEEHNSKYKKEILKRADTLKTV